MSLLAIIAQHREYVTSSLTLKLKYRTFYSVSTASAAITVDISLYHSLSQTAQSMGNRGGHRKDFFCFFLALFEKPTLRFALSSRSFSCR